MRDTSTSSTESVLRRENGRGGADTESTLPSIVAAGRGRYAARALTLTIAFHPDTRRIGEVARVPVHDPRMPCVLGRRSPLFSAPGRSGEEPLCDPHVSRRALTLEYSDSRLRLHRARGSSRARLGDTLLEESATLDTAQLQHGVPLLLGHAVVLILRLQEVEACAEGDLPDAVPGAGLDDYQLRGSGPVMRRLREHIRVAAATTGDVLIRGETGTGKELVATAIHTASPRSDMPLVRVNMAAVPTDLAPSLLFGSARGAFTGAERSTTGYFEQANGGTLFLDEIGDTPAPVQAQILRALQQREIQVVGGAIKSVDIRILSATDVNLEDDTSHFKAALRHRLAGHEITVPPLREHPEDIGELLAFFAREVALESGVEQLLPGPDSSAVDHAGWAFVVFLALRYHWPGNVRELRNVVRHMVVSAGRPMDLPERFEAQVAHRRDDATEAANEPGLQRMADIDDEAFGTAMEQCGFEPARVARTLQVSRTAVYRRIEMSSRYALASDLPDALVEQALAECDDDEVEAARRLQVSVAGLRQRLRVQGRPRR